MRDAQGGMAMENRRRSRIKVSSWRANPKQWIVAGMAAVMVASIGYGIETGFFTDLKLIRRGEAQNVATQRARRSSPLMSRKVARQKLKKRYERMRQRRVEKRRGQAGPSRQVESLREKLRSPLDFVESPSQN